MMAATLVVDSGRGITEQIGYPSLMIDILLRTSVPPIVDLAKIGVYDIAYARP